MPLYDCGDQDCEECRKEFGPNREKAIRNFEAREAFCEQELRELANTVKNVTIESCAKVAAGHNGISPKDSRDIANKIRLLSTATTKESEPS